VINLRAPRVPQLDDAHQDVLNVLVSQIIARAPKNRLRWRYYDHKATLKDLGIAIPPQLTTVETVVGWPAKGVDGLTNRTVLDGFTSQEASTADLGLDWLWEENRMESEIPQAHTASAAMAPAFTFVTQGDVAAGEPESLITSRSALWATGTWDARRRGLKDALSVVSVDENGYPDHMAMYLPNLVIVMRRSGQKWDVRQAPHDLGLPVEPLIYRPMLDVRPLGSSRISRAVRALTDSAIRTLLRTEVSAEFFSAPQRYILGADEEAFEDADGNAIPGWQAIIGRLLGVGRDEDGNIPTVGQFSQQSMEPHLAQVRQIASLFAAEMNMTPRSFGIMQDNPESAEAIMSAREDLVVEARNWQKTLGPAWKRTAVNALRLIDDSAAARAAYASLRPHWMNPATPSVVSASDAFVKQAAYLPELRSSGVAYELLGYDADQTDRLDSARRREDARASLMAAPSDVAV